MTGPQDQAATVAPCTADDAVSTIYDPQAYGRCANGHPLNRAGRCPALNGLVEQQPEFWSMPVVVMVPS